VKVSCCYLSDLSGWELKNYKDYALDSEISDLLEDSEPKEYLICEVSDGGRPIK
jgi:hypothetical protein